MSELFYCTIFPGLEPIVESIINEHDALTLHTTNPRRDNSLIFFTHTQDVKKLMQLRFCEDIFYYLGEIPLTGEKIDLSTIKEFMIANNRLERGLFLHKAIHPKHGKYKTKYRAISQSLSKHRYRRVDAQSAVEKGINIRYQQKWQRVDDQADVEFWIHLGKKSAHVGLRLSDKHMRHRMYKKNHLKASLRPTIAYAMVWLSGIDPEDVFLDPFCGAGTLIIERAHAGAYAQLFASDLSSEAIASTKANLAGRYQPITVNQEDATNLSHPKNTISKIVSNLPFGKQISTQEQIKNLYPTALQEMERVLCEDGKVVLLVHDLNLLKNAVNSTNTLSCGTIYSNILVLGESAHIAIITKK